MTWHWRRYNGWRILWLHFSAGFDELIAAAILDVEADPCSLAEVQSHSDWPCWKETMDFKLATLERAGTWVTVPCPTDKNIVGSKWVFHIKCKADESINKYKAWLVAWGFTQIYRVDYFTTFLPVAKLSSFCTLLAITVCHNWDIQSFNFNGAYLNGELDENKEVYMYPAPGYDKELGLVKWLCKSLSLWAFSNVIQISQLFHKIWLARFLQLNWITLENACIVYRLKQAGQKWYDTLSCALANLLAVHLDDCVFAGSSSLLVTE